MDEAEALAALEWLRPRMWDDKMMATLLDVQNLDTRGAFANGLVAMVEAAASPPCTALAEVIAR